MGQEELLKIWNAAIEAVHPIRLMQQHISISKQILQIADFKLSLSEIGDVYLIGVGKASGAMAAEAASILGEHLTDSLITVKHGHEVNHPLINSIVASHPVPDEYSVKAVSLTLSFLKKVKENDVVICLLSGGASSLWCDVPLGLTMEQLSQTYSMLINSGAAIDEINTVRKHLSLIKGGQLVKYCKGQLFTLAISDVPGDDLSIIGSGPTFPDSSTFADALDILYKYHIADTIPASVLKYLNDGDEGLLAETPKPRDFLFENVKNTIIGSNLIAIKAAANLATSLGFNVHPEKSLIIGETEEEAVKLVSELSHSTFEKPYCIIQGGETVINVTGNGKGGRNQHFALAALAELNKQKDYLATDNLLLLSAGTDGTDGPTDAAGAIISMDILKIALHENISIEAYLKDNDAYHFFKQVGGLLHTGPTQTNVMDLQILMVI